jgi:hypothetical protein
MLAIDSALRELQSRWYRFARSEIADAEVPLTHTLTPNRRNSARASHGTYGILAQSCGGGRVAPPHGEFDKRLKPQPMNWLDAAVRAAGSLRLFGSAFAEVGFLFCRRVDFSAERYIPSVGRFLLGSG